MASLTRYSKGYKIRYRIYYPDGTDRVAFAYRGIKRDAEQVLSQASQLESITRQNALTLKTATPFQHWRLLSDEDLSRWFLRRSGPLRYEAQALLEAYRIECTLHCTSHEVIRENTRRAGKFVDEFGNVARLTEADLRAWQQALVGRVSRKTVNLYLDTLRQLLDLCVRFGWREDNPARTIRKLPWKVSQLPQALTREQVQRVLEEARARGVGEPPASLQGGLYRLLAARIILGLRWGELQYLLRLTLHSLRHTFATWRLMMGDPLLVKGWMGHASAETLLRYAHVQPDPLQDLLPLLKD